MAETGTSRNPEWRIAQIIPGSETYTERAKECRRLAEIGPEHWKENYLELAVEYERLANAAEYEVVGRLSWRLLERWLLQRVVIIAGMAVCELVAY